MNHFSILTFLILNGASTGFDYCSKSNYHMFCGVDCLRPPNLCNQNNMHSQLSITKGDITAITDSLNNLRDQAVTGTMNFITSYKNWMAKWTTMKYNLENRPYKMNLIVS